MLDKLIQPLIRLLGEKTIAVIGAVSILLAVTWTVYSFLWRSTDTQQNYFYAAKLKACIEVSEAVATIASATDQVTLRDAKAVFWRYYYGPLVIFEDENLEKAMRNFGENLVTEAEVGDINNLRRHALKVSAACHDLVSLGLFSQLRARLLPTVKRGRYGQ